MENSILRDKLDLVEAYALDHSAENQRLDAVMGIVAVIMTAGTLALIIVGIQAFVK